MSEQQRQVRYVVNVQADQEARSRIPEVRSYAPASPFKAPVRGEHSREHCEALCMLVEDHIVRWEPIMAKLRALGGEW